MRALSVPTVSVLQFGRSFRAAEGAIGFCSTVLIDGAKRTLVDTGHVGRRSGLLRALRQREISAESIDVVVLTHAHWDHSQNLDLFPNAQILIGRAELEYARSPREGDFATPQWTGAMLDSHRGVVSVDNGHSVEPGVVVLTTPGHSPGTLSVVVETGAERAAVTGDAIPRAQDALSGVNPVVFHSTRQASESIQRLREIADVFYPGHDLPFRIVGDGVEYLERSIIKMYGLYPGDPDQVQFRVADEEPWVMPGSESD